MENKFRVFCGGDMWCPEDESRNGALEDWYLTPDGRLCELTSTYDGVEVEWYPKPRAFVMFWTGLKDKDGKDVYAGDILEFDAEGWRKERIGEVAWYPSAACWGIVNVDCDFYEIVEWGKIIGNIHEDPELIRGE